MATEISFNKKLNEVKLLLSSLFARKLHWVVFNGDDPNTLIFTSVTADRIVFYRPEIDDQMSLVKVSDEGIKFLYELFPIFRSTCGMIQLPTFLSTVNKLVAETKGVAPNIRVDLERDAYLLDAPKTSKVEFELDESSRPTEVWIGHLLTEDTYLRYKQVFSNHTAFGVSVIEKIITLNASARTDKVTPVDIHLNNELYNTEVCFRLPIQDGTNIVSFTEYLSKRKAEWKYRVMIYYDEKHSVARTACLYKDEWVDVMSITPAALWFPRRMKK